MKVLVIGSGGREHAIVWKLKQSPKVTELYCAPGNAGINEIVVGVDIKADDVEGLLKFVKENGIELTVVGPEVPLEKGIVDEFTKEGLLIFGPQKSAARLEHSKIFAKDFMKRNNIPTAAYETFSLNDKAKVYDFISNTNYPLVIKADGLAAGKGVIICGNVDEAIQTVNELFNDKIFGAAGENIVIEQFLTGVEASVFAICDGTDYIVLPASQDHKKIGDDETGKNTGGMGSYSPADRAVNHDVMKKIKQRVIEPVLKYMKSEGNEFKGCLYCGLMIDKSGDPYVIEFNTRFGDPETQVVLPTISSDLAEMFISSANGSIGNYELKLNGNFCCTVVLASNGYPDKYETGKEITGLNEISRDAIVFHAGTKSTADGKILTNGGRVLNVTGISPLGLKEAINIAYHNAVNIDFENKYNRTDIGLKGL
ncbi:MAG: phosphoribosylamine--glycine ligase [Ignavibacteria bacterium]|nr:phosphoribosylamine--glycine ligase [Ignavibacteria bacterium]